MLKTTLHHYRKLSLRHRALLAVFFFLGTFTAIFRFLYAETLSFEDQIASMFSWLDTGYYSNTHFQYDGNDFVGIIFWQLTETGYNEHITISGGSQEIVCTEKLRGIYYNNQRGRRIWPLDTGNLSILSGYGSGYETMTMSNGLFTNCTGVTGYTPAANEVYGQITHVIDGTTGELFAGIDYDFATNTISGTYFSGSMTITSGGVHEGHIFDSAGGIAQLGMNLPYCGGFEVSSASFSGGQDTRFLCQGNSVEGYILRIFSGGTSVFEDQTNSTGTSYLWTTGASLPSGNYIATCTILGSGEIPLTCGGNLTFTVLGTSGSSDLGTGCDPDFQGLISFASLSGSNVYSPYSGMYYTNSTGILLQWSATSSNSIYISGNFNESPITGSYTGSDLLNDIGILPIHLQNANNRNNFFSTFNTGSCSYADIMRRVYVDTTAPSAPIISSPASGAYVCPSTPLNISWSGSTDTGANISHYTYEIYNTSGVVTGLLLSGTSAGSSTGISLSQISLLPLGTYYIRIGAVDNVGHISYSLPATFTTSSLYCTSGTGIMFVTPQLSIDNADLDTLYRSQPIYILGLTGPAELTISTGMLFINDATGGIMSSGIITSQDTIYIELISSQSYDTTVSSTLSILGHTGSFSVTTKAVDCVLSASEQLLVQNIYNTLKDEYNNDISKYAEFLNTFQSMVDDEVDLSNDCNLTYLLHLIEDDFGDEGIDTRDHITPNCKEYSIDYSSEEQGYFSPDMMIRYYFVNRESLIRHLDFYNPGDCHINTYNDNYRTTDNDDEMKHIAPNGKIYNLIGQYGGYSALEFATPKYFDSLAAIKSYIDLRNPAKTIWRHDIDDTFLPIVYAAPNGKEYKIYKTSRGFMSYKLMKVQYFDTLSAIKSYIDKNNPSKR